MVTYTYKLKPRAVRDGYLGDLIDRHNMLWNKFVWLEEISRKRRGKHINGTALDRYVNLHKKGHGWDYMIKESKGTRGCAGGASSVDVGQSGKPVRESRWARIRKSSKPQGGDAGLAEGDLHGTQTHGDGYVGGIPQALAVGGCQWADLTADPSFCYNMLRLRRERVNADQKTE